MQSRGWVLSTERLLFLCAALVLKQGMVTSQACSSIPLAWHSLMANSRGSYPGSFPVVPVRHSSHGSMADGYMVVPLTLACSRTVLILISLQAIQNPAQFFLLGFPSFRCVGFLARPVEALECRKPDSPHFPFGGCHAVRAVSL